MEIGISSSCYYPGDTLASLEKALDAGAPVTEVFLNTFRELEPGYVARLGECARRRGGRILSVHPFTSALEPFLFFSEYETRFEDGLALYRRYFEVCRLLGASVLVFHGNMRAKALSMQEYARRLCRLVEEGEKYGVTVAQENVDRCQSGDVASIRALRRYAGRPLRFVLDLKQCRRFGCDIREMADAMGPENICHLHLSDQNERCLSALPGRGEFDFRGLFEYLREGGCTAGGVIELYRGDFGAEEELRDALAYLSRQSPEEKTI